MPHSIANVALTAGSVFRWRDLQRHLFYLNDHRRRAAAGCVEFYDPYLDYERPLTRLRFLVEFLLANNTCRHAYARLYFDTHEPDDDVECTEDGMEPLCDVCRDHGQMTYIRDDDFVKSIIDAVQARESHTPLQVVRNCRLGRKLSHSDRLQIIAVTTRLLCLDVLKAKPLKPTRGPPSTERKWKAGVRISVSLITLHQW